MRAQPARLLRVVACLACALLVQQTSAAGPATGVHFELGDVFEAAGWAVAYRAPYYDNTVSADLDPVSTFSPAACVVVGAKPGIDAPFKLAAFTTVEAFGTKTSGSETYESRGVLWYRNPAKSVGFCTSPPALSSADTVTGDDRLSWHLNRGVGGYRAGSTVGLNTDTDYIKAIYVAPVPCDALGNDMRPAVGVDGPYGAYTDIPAHKLSGWTMLYHEVYSHHTKSSDVDVSAYGSDACVFMGAQRAGTLLYQLGAFCDAATFKPTAVPNQLVVGRGVKWYMLPGWSVGFTADGDVAMSSADTHTGELRLSWHLDQSVGGYRVGNLVGVVSGWYKVVLVAPVPCSQISADLELPAAGFGPCPAGKAGIDCTLDADTASGDLDVTPVAVSLDWNRASGHLDLSIAGLQRPGVHVTGVTLACLPLSAAIFTCSGEHAECRASVLWSSVQSACSLPLVSRDASTKGFKVNVDVAVTSTRSRDSYGNELSKPVVSQSTASGRAFIVTHQVVTSVTAAEETKVFVVDAHVSSAVVVPATSPDGYATVSVGVAVTTSSDIQALEVRPGSRHEGHGELAGEPVVTSACSPDKPRCEHSLTFNVRALAATCEFSGFTSLLLRAICAHCDRADVVLNLNFTSMHPVEYCLPDVDTLAGKGILYLSTDNAVAAPGSPAAITFVTKVVHEEGTHASPAEPSSLVSVLMRLLAPGEVCEHAGAGYEVVGSDGVSKSSLVTVSPADQPDAAEHVVTLTVASTPDDVRQLMLFSNGNTAAQDAFVQQYSGRICVEVTRLATMDFGGSRRLSSKLEVVEVRPAASVGINVLGIGDGAGGLRTPPVSWDASLNVHLQFPVQGVRTGDMAPVYVPDADINELQALVVPMLARAAGLPEAQVLSLQVRFARPAAGAPAQVEASFALVLRGVSPASALEATDALHQRLSSLTYPGSQFKRDLRVGLAARGLGHIGDPQIALHRSSEAKTETPSDGVTIVISTTLMVWVGGGIAVVVLVVLASVVTAACVRRQVSPLRDQVQVRGAKETQLATRINAVGAKPGPARRLRNGPDAHKYRVGKAPAPATLLQV